MGLISAVARRALKARGNHLERSMVRAEMRGEGAQGLVAGLEDDLASGDFGSRLRAAYLVDSARKAEERAFVRESTMRRKLRGNDRMLERF